MVKTLHPQELSGLLVVNKPVGMVSKDVSRWLSKRLGSKVKMGHVGTLDPAAEGVLPILLGKATRLQDLLLDLPKTYECDVSLGSETDSLDSDGQLVKEMPYEHVTRDGLEEASQDLLGKQLQVPPIYSAVKYLGKPLYFYARNGRADEVDLDALARNIDIYEFKILEFSGQVVTFRLRCSKGTYVRVAARDLARKLGTCGTITRLCRTESSGVAIRQSFSLEEIEKFLEKNGQLREPLLIPMESLDLGLSSLPIDDLRSVAMLRSGQKVRIKDGLASVRGSELGKLIGNRSQEKLLLLDRDGRAFGLGLGHPKPDELQVEMKRSLL
ncbi:MAG: tRNA pseudouridine(55) synthase TruB [Oligoflexales bacterium]